MLVELREEPDVRNSTRIVDSRGKYCESACTVHACHASEDRDGHRDLGGDRERGVRPRLTRSSTPLRRMPAEHAALERGHGEVDRDAEDPGRERVGVQVDGQAVRRRVVDLLAEARHAHEQLGGEREDERDRRRDPDAGHDVRHRARQRDAAEAARSGRGRTSARCRPRAGRRRARRRSSGSGAARTRRTRRGRPRS